MLFWNAIIGIQTDLSLILSPNWLSSSQSHSHHNVSNIQEMTWKYKCRNYPNLHEVSISWNISYHKTNSRKCINFSSVAEIKQNRNNPSSKLGRKSADKHWTDFRESPKIYEQLLSNSEWHRISNQYAGSNDPNNKLDAMCQYSIVFGNLKF